MAVGRHPVEGHERDCLVCERMLECLAELFGIEQNETNDETFPASGRAVEKQEHLVVMFLGGRNLQEFGFCIAKGCKSYVVMFGRCLTVGRVSLPEEGQQERRYHDFEGPCLTFAETGRPSPLYNAAGGTVRATER